MLFENRRTFKIIKKELCKIHCSLYNIMQKRVFNLAAIVVEGADTAMAKLQ